MHVLLVGGGGREHALAWKILQSPLVTRFSATDANPGFPAETGRAGGDPVDWASASAVDLVVVGPEAPLADGIVDRCSKVGIDAFGPTRAAARLEASKSFAKAFMDRHGIPTATWSLHQDAASARAAISGPVVVKADGLAAGKGVIVASHASEAIAAVDDIFSGRFGEAGSQVLLEERLSGEEISLLALCDGERALPLLPCRDHKRRFDGDRGPNTGGMGAICPPPDVDPALIEEIRRTVLQATVDGMRDEGTPFHGVLYAGLMLTAQGPRVLEFNVRFGDPECQPLMMMLDEDLVPLMVSAARGDLPHRSLRWHPGATCCVVAVSGGYPGDYDKGHVITGVPDPSTDRVVFYAGARRDGDAVVSSGGRVLGVTARGASLDEARRLAYDITRGVAFETAAWRTDIGGPPIGEAPEPPPRRGT